VCGVHKIDLKLQVFSPRFMFSYMIYLRNCLTDFDYILLWYSAILVSRVEVARDDMTGSSLDDWIY
jgi:hypothetical protein